MSVSNPLYKSAYVESIYEMVCKSIIRYEEEVWELK
jgi:hypothetical protein